MTKKMLLFLISFTLFSSRLFISLTGNCYLLGLYFLFIPYLYYLYECCLFVVCECLDHFCGYHRIVDWTLKREYLYFICRLYNYIWSKRKKSTNLQSKCFFFSFYNRPCCLQPGNCSKGPYPALHKKIRYPQYAI